MNIIELAGYNEESLEMVEPVAWGIVASNTGRICQVELDAEEVADHNPTRIVPLYAAPRPRKRLTDEEILDIGKAARAVEGQHILPVTFARAIEDAIWRKT
jgi:hypothetical protein